jgi:hypothetical protein
MRRRTWVSLAVVAVIIVVLGVAAYLRKNAPPEVARLLPQADAIVYLNLKPLRALTHFDRERVIHDPGYQDFINATGIEFERDLDQVAIALQRMADPNGPNGPVAYSEVFRGHFDGPRLTAYLAAHAAGVEHYAGRTIYAIPHDGRTVRATILGYDLVAVSNAPTPKPIDTIIDRHHTAASPFSGDALLSRYYKKVPLLSEAWGIGQLGLPFASGNNIDLFGMPLPIQADSEFVASIRYLGVIHILIEELANSEDDARETAGMANVALGLLRSVNLGGDASNADAKAWNRLLRSISVKQKGKRAILKATVPTSLLRRLLTPPENESQQDENQQ